mgnify:FL=1
MSHISYGRLMVLSADKALTENDIRHALTTGVLAESTAQSLLMQRWRDHPGSAPPEDTWDTAVSNIISDWDAAGPFQVVGGEDDDEEDRADRGGEDGTAFSAKDIADAIEALTGTPTGRRNIFERERAPSGMNPLLANIQRSRFDPLNAEFILNQAGNLATAPQDFATFIQNRTPINALGGFGTFGQQVQGAGTGPSRRAAGTGLLGNVQDLFSMANPTLVQVGARAALEQAARRDPGTTGNILSQIATSGISPMFRGFAEEELGRRIGQLSPLSQANPFQAYLGGQLSF